MDYDPRRIYTWEMPARLVFGAEAAKQVGQELRALGGGKVLVVTDKGIVKAGLLEGVLASLRKVEMPAVVFEDVEPNPSVPCVEKAFALYQAEKCDCLVGLGGGSSMDTAKAVGVLATNPGKITDYEGMYKVKNSLPPFVAIPTTCGTGSETTFMAVITDLDRKFKFAVGSPLNLPKVALIDPLMLVNLPGPIVAATGMDALTHAVESYTNANVQPVSDALDIQAIRMIGKSLRGAVANGNLNDIANMVLGSTIAGMGFTNTRLTLVHAMSHPVSAHAGTPHGIANAILLPYVMEYNLIGATERFAEVAWALGEDTRGLTAMEAAELAVEAVRRLMIDVGIPLSLKAVGVTAEMVPVLADDSMKSGNVPLNPRRASRQDVAEIFQRALG
ncbi:MAG: iron-containing alcohol dehydrogenase [Chloroflexi bacterium]|nr:iron-containing alcohol dehydrogenase [Chloroflexota bacterium]